MHELPQRKCKCKRNRRCKKWKIFHFLAFAFALAFAFHMCVTQSQGFTQGENTRSMPLGLTR